VNVKKTMWAALSAIAAVAFSMPAALAEKESKSSTAVPGAETARDSSNAGSPSAAGASSQSDTGAQNPDRKQDRKAKRETRREDRANRGIGAETNYGAVGGESSGKSSNMPGQ